MNKRLNMDQHHIRYHCNLGYYASDNYRVTEAILFIIINHKLLVKYKRPSKDVTK